MSSESTSKAGRIITGILGGVFLLFLFIFLYAPLVVTALYSFNSTKTQSYPMTGFSLKWYTDLFADKQMISAIGYSLQVAICAVIISAIAGVAFALILNRARFRGSKGMDLAIASPLVTPGMVLGISLLIVFSFMKIKAGFITVVIGHAAFITPLVAYIVQQRLKSLDPSLEQASMDLGAGPLKTFWHVILPGIRVALIAGCLIGFTMSMDEVAVTFFLSGTKATLPVYVWSLVRFGFTPEVNAAFTIIGIGSLILIGIAGALIYFNGRKSRIRVSMSTEAELAEIGQMEAEIEADAAAHGVKLA